MIQHQHLHRGGGNHARVVEVDAEDLAESRRVGVHDCPRVAESLQETVDGVESAHRENVVHAARHLGEIAENVPEVRRFPAS